MHLWITHDTKFIRNSHWSPWYPPLHLHVWFNSKQNNNVQKHIKKTHTNHILQYSTNKTTEITITCHTYVPGKPQAQTIKFQHSCCPSHRQTANPDITDYKQWINSTYDITHEITPPPTAHRSKYALTKILCLLSSYHCGFGVYKDGCRLVASSSNYLLFPFVLLAGETRLFCVSAYMWIQCAPFVVSPRGVAFLLFRKAVSFAVAATFCFPRP